MTPDELIDDAWTAFLASLAELETRSGMSGLDEAASAYSPWLRARDTLLGQGLPEELADDIGRLVQDHDHSILHRSGPDAEAWAEQFAQQAEAVTLTIRHLNP